MENANNFISALGSSIEDPLAKMLRFDMDLSLGKCCDSGPLHIFDFGFKLIMGVSDFYLELPTINRISIPEQNQRSPRTRLEAIFHTNPMKLGFKRNTATIGVSPVPFVGGIECTVDAVTQVEISEASVQTTFEIVTGEFIEARVDDITVPDINVDIRITSLSGDGLCDRSVSGDVKQQLNNLLEKLSTFTDLVASETREKVRDAARAAIRDALSDVRFKVPLYASVVSETKHAGEISAGQKLLGAGTDCWGNCDSRAGPCSACGEMGACCKAGERDRFCNIPACRPICASWVPIIGCIWSTYSPSNLPCDHHTCTINSEEMLRVEQWADPVRGVVGFQAHLGLQEMVRVPADVAGQTAVMLRFLPRFVVTKARAGQTGATSVTFPTEGGVVDPKQCSINPGLGELRADGVDSVVTISQCVLQSMMDAIWYALGLEKSYTGVTRDDENYASIMDWFDQPKDGRPVIIEFSATPPLVTIVEGSRFQVGIVLGVKVSVPGSTRLFGMENGMQATFPMPRLQDGKLAFSLATSVGAWSSGVQIANTGSWLKDTATDFVKGLAGLDDPGKIAGKISEAMTSIFADLDDVLQELLDGIGPISPQYVPTGFSCEPHEDSCDVNEPKPDGASGTEIMQKHDDKVFDWGWGMVYLHPSHGGANQRFFVEPAGVRSRLPRPDRADESMCRMLCDAYDCSQISEDGGCDNLRTKDGLDNLAPYNNIAACKGFQCHLRTTSEKYYTIKVAHPSGDKKCLDWNRSDRKLIMFDCHGGDNQLWYFIGGSGLGVDGASLVKVKSDPELCLEYKLDGSSELHLHTCHGNPNQRFHFNVVAKSGLPGCESSADCQGPRGCSKPGGSKIGVCVGSARGVCCRHGSENLIGGKPVGQVCHDGGCDSCSIIGCDGQSPRPTWCTWPTGTTDALMLTLTGVEKGITTSVRSRVTDPENFWCKKLCDTYDCTRIYAEGGCDNLPAPFNDIAFCKAEECHLKYKEVDAPQMQITSGLAAEPSRYACGD